MNFLIDNWFLFIAAIALIISLTIFIYGYIREPKQEQIAKLKEWLLIAVVEAEKVLGAGTGELKLRYVYDAFITKFPYLSKVISFEQFKIYIDEALNKLENLLITNENINEYLKK